MKASNGVGAGNEYHEIKTGPRLEIPSEFTDGARGAETPVTSRWICLAWPPSSTRTRSRPEPTLEFAADSPLEGGGFKPSAATPLSDG